MHNDRNGIVGLILGFLFGVPISYYFQPGMIRGKLSLGAYLQHLPELITRYPSDVVPPILLCCTILGAIGWFAARQTARVTQ